MEGAQNIAGLAFVRSKQAAHHCNERLSSTPHIQEMCPDLCVYSYSYCQIQVLFSTVTMRRNIK